MTQIYPLDRGQRMKSTCQTPSCSLSSLKCLGTAHTGLPGFYFGQVEPVCAELQSWLPLRPRQAPPSMGVSRQEYWSGLPCPPAGALLDPRLKPVSLKSPTLAGVLFTTSATWELVRQALFVALLTFSR